MTSLFRITGLWIALATLSARSAAPEWPEWRGPGGQGHAAPQARPPLHWSETEGVIWKTPIPGRGWSSPVVGGKQLWVTTALETPAKPEDARRRLSANTADQPLVLLEKVELHAVCIDRDSGRIVHDIPLFSEQEPQWVHELNSYASPTPVLEQGRAYFHFGTFGTACVDTRSGKVLWTRNDLRIMHENGPGSSPILWKNRLIFHLDGSDSQSVVALDTANGTIAWRTPRSGEMASHPQLKKSYATPAIVKLGGRDHLVSQGADWLYGYDPATGRELWKVRYGQTGFSLSSRAVFGHGMSYLSTGFMKPEIQAIELEAQPQPVQRWKYSKGAPTMPSLLLIDDGLYFVSDSGGFFTCLDARSGAERFRERLGGNHNASPLYAGGHIYLPSREGSVMILEPGRQFRAVATNTVSGKIMATPAAVGRSLFLRTDRALYRIESTDPMNSMDASGPESDRSQAAAGQPRLTDEAVIAQTRLWLEKAVIGLNLCPFARAEYVRNRVAFRVSAAATPEALLTDLESALRELVEAAPSSIETTLLIHPQVLQDFLDYNEFLGEAEALLVRMELEGVIQIASFHPRYRFAGEDPGDMSHFTNRSPYPTLHLLRESSIERAVRGGEDAETIVARNLKTVRELGPEGWRRLGLGGPLEG